MIKVYHGSLEEVRVPRILVPNRPLDYGAGFYTTTSELQAKQWVLRKLKKGMVGYVNVYYLNRALLSSLKTLSFVEPTEEWVDFVIKNRTDRGYVHDFDVVYGPVANDRVYAAFGLYESGLINKQMLILELKTYTLVDQYLFHTEKSLNAIQFIEKKEIRI